MVDQLKEVLVLNIDVQKGYAKAVENADSHRLKNYFYRKVKERLPFNDAQKAELVANYDEIIDDGSFTGTLHRAWMDVQKYFISPYKGKTRTPWCSGQITYNKKLI